MLPFSDRIINLVHELATAEDAEGLYEDGVPIMEWEGGTPIMIKEVKEQK